MQRPVYDDNGRGLGPRFAGCVWKAHCNSKTGVHLNCISGAGQGVHLQFAFCFLGLDKASRTDTRWGSLLLGYRFAHMASVS